MSAESEYIDALNKTLDHVESRLKTAMEELRSKDVQIEGLKLTIWARDREIESLRSLLERRILEGDVC